MISPKKEIHNIPGNSKLYAFIINFMLKTTSVLMFVLSILNICLGISIALKLGDENACEMPNSDGKPYVTCCSGYIYQKEQNKCHDCPMGTFGLNCSFTCSPNFYGLRCKSKCTCANIEKCNPISGECEDIYELATANDKITYATFLPVTSSEDSSFLGLSPREVVIYSIGIGSLTGLLLVLLCLGRYTLNIHRNRPVLPQIESSRNNVSLRMVSTGYNDGIYETIDETNMIDVSLEVTVPITVESTSSESTDSEHSLSYNEYINSYQQMVTDPERHVYK